MAQFLWLPILKAGRIQWSSTCQQYQNLNWKFGQQTQSVRTLFLGKKVFCFSRSKAEIFSIFLKRNCETSLNFNSIRQQIEKMKIEILWMSRISWNFVRFFAKFFSSRCWKFQLSIYLEQQKSFIPKKIFFRPLSISKQKSFVYWPNFQWRFWSDTH